MSPSAGTANKGSRTIARNTFLEIYCLTANNCNTVELSENKEESPEDVCRICLLNSWMRMG